MDDELNLEEDDDMDVILAMERDAGASFPLQRLNQQGGSPTAGGTTSSSSKAQRTFASAGLHDFDSADDLYNFSDDSHKSAGPRRTRMIDTGNLLDSPIEEDYDSSDDNLDLNDDQIEEIYQKYTSNNRNRTQSNNNTNNNTNNNNNVDNNKNSDDRANRGGNIDEFKSCQGLDELDTNFMDDIASYEIEALSSELLANDTISKNNDKNKKKTQNLQNANNAVNSASGGGQAVHLAELEDLKDNDQKDIEISQDELFDNSLNQSYAFANAPHDGDVSVSTGGGEQNQSNSNNLDRFGSTSGRKRKFSSLDQSSNGTDWSDGMRSKRQRTASSGAFAHTGDFGGANDFGADAAAAIEPEIFLHNRPSISGNSVMITSFTGEKKYVYFDSIAMHEIKLKHCLKGMRRGGYGATGDCSDDVATMLREIEQERLNKMIEESKQHIEEINASFREIDENTGSPPDSPLANDSADTVTNSDDLWVDKYAPDRFTQLLSSEMINREVLQWVKSWDYIVFGHKYRRQQHTHNNKYVASKFSHFSKSSKNGLNQSNRSKPVQFISSMPRFGPKRVQTTQMNQNAKISIGSVWNVESLDKLKRPEYPVILLCGAPGTGKTTLAHLIARHCGYRPFEVNASDDRDGATLKQVIVNAVTMRPMFGKSADDYRPPLVIIDEIDGVTLSKRKDTGGMAGGGRGSKKSTGSDGKGGGRTAVEIIVNLVERSSRAWEARLKERKEAILYGGKHGKRVASSKKSRSDQILNRPIICICNDQYAKALRPLRKFAKVFVFKPISANKLCRRLLEVCRSEFLHCDMKCLSYLGSITHNDVRACLHTLQFFKKQAGGGKRVSNRLTVSMLQSIPIGRKDLTHHLFDLWNRVLKKQTRKDTKKKLKEQTLRDAGPRGGGRDLVGLDNIDDMIEEMSFENERNKPKEIGEKENWREIRTMIPSMDNNKIFEGVWENWITMGATDHLCELSQMTSESLANIDIMKRQIDSRQHFMLLAYVPYFYINVHETIAVDSFRRLEYPTKDYKFVMAKKDKFNIVKTFLHPDLQYLRQYNEQVNKQIELSKKQKKGAGSNNGGNGPNGMDMDWNGSREDLTQVSVFRYAETLSRYFNFTSTILELIPFVLFIISPRFSQTSNLSAFHGFEKRKLVSMINTMIECGLNYYPTRNFSSHHSKSYFPDIVWEMRPSIASVATSFEFTSVNLKRSLESSFKLYNNHLKRSIAHEIELEIMRRNESAAAKYDAFLSSDPSTQEASQTARNSRETSQSLDTVAMTPAGGKRRKQGLFGLTPFTPKTPFFKDQENMRSGNNKNEKGRKLKTPGGNGMFGAKIRPGAMMETPAKTGKTGNGGKRGVRQTSMKKNFIRAHAKTVITERYEYPVQYKFVEGYTNAVKRKVFVKDWV